jgi:hypothetical protein
MRTHVWMGSAIVILTAVGWGLCAEPPCCEPARNCFVGGFAPAGGWHPYGGGLLRWWPQHCFPRCGAPDDYCRKPLPSVCWPPYPPYYVWGPPDTGCARESCPPTSGKPH